MNKNYIKSTILGVMLITMSGCGSTASNNDSEIIQKKLDTITVERDELLIQLQKTENERDAIEKKLADVQQQLDRIEALLKTLQDQQVTPTAPPATPSSTTSNINQTGQTITYDVNGTENPTVTSYDDGFYTSGATSSYTKERNTIIDNVTNLMWQDNNQVGVDKKQWVTDAKYGEEKFDDTTGDTAANYCSRLTLDSYDDWRLPTVNELRGIIDYGKKGPAISEAFQYKNSSAYWTSNSNKKSSNYERAAWSISFSLGTVGLYDKDSARYIRCVREN